MDPSVVANATRQHRRRPILVTGSHRSGSTWVGRMLATSPIVAYLHEPFHMRHYPCSCGVPFRFWFQYICSDNGALFREHFKDAIRPSLGSKHRLASQPVGLKPELRRTARVLRENLLAPRSLIKEPLAFFSAEWLVSEFEADPIILIRHPGAFASSLRLKNWQFDFNQMLAQPLLMRDHLEPFRSEIEAAARRKPDILDQAVLLWRIIYRVALTYRERHPDWMFVRHEDLSRDPVHGFEDMFRHTRLSYTEENRGKVLRSSAEGNPSEAPGNVVHWLDRDSRRVAVAWKQRLTPQEITHIREGVEDVSSRYYAESDW
jgi:hypothetical protein